jgi:hypothetical protein
MSDCWTKALCHLLFEAGLVGLACYVFDLELVLFVALH